MVFVKETQLLLHIPIASLQVEEKLITKKYIRVCRDKNDHRIKED